MNKIIKKTVGLDLTSPVAQHRHGMANLVLTFLKGFKYLNSSIKIVLFCKHKSAKIYEEEVDGQIKIFIGAPCDWVKDGNQLHLLFHPFNGIFSTCHGVQNVVTICDLIPIKFPELYPNNAMEETRHAARVADHIIAISKSTKNDIVNYLGVDKEKITDCVCAIDSINIQKNYNDVSSLNISRPYIVYPATFRPHKNHVRLLKAFFAAKTEFILVLSTGEVHQPQRINDLQNLIDSLKLTNIVINAKNMDQKLYYNVLKKSSGLIFPSLSEGFGLPVLEAFFLGKKVACSANSSLIEFAQSRAHLFSPYKHSEIVHAIEDLWDQRNNNFDIHDNYLLFERYHPKKQAADYISVFERIIDNFQNIKSLNSSSFTLIGSANALYSSSFDSKYADCIYKLSSERYSSHIFSNSITVACQSKTHRVVRSKKSRVSCEKIILLIDVTRLFCNNEHSGITKYVRRILRELVDVNNFIVIPFYLPSARGYNFQENDFNVHTVVLDSNNTITVHSWNQIELLAQAFSGNVIYFSCYHPLPLIRVKEWFYCLTIFDILHLTDAEKYPDGETRKYITIDIVKSIKSSDLILCISQFTMRQIYDYLNFEPLGSIVYLAPMITCFDNLSTFRDIDVLIPFQNDPRKNFATMVRAVIKFVKSNSHRAYKIHVFGRPQLTDSPDMKVLMRDLSEMVSFSVAPSDEELGHLYCRAKCMLYLSESEGFGLPPLEAMSCGCPAIVPDNTSLSEIFFAWDYILSRQYSDEEVARLINEILAENINDITQRSLDFSKKFTWRRTLAMHLGGFTKLLSQAKAIR